MTVDLANLVNKDSLDGTEQVIINDNGVARDITINAISTSIKDNVINQIVPPGGSLVTTTSNSSLGVIKKSTTGNTAFIPSRLLLQTSGDFYLKAPGVELFDMATTTAAPWSLAGATGTAAINSSNVWTAGKPTLDLQCTAGAGSTLNATYNCASPMTAGQAPTMLVPIWVEDYTRVNNITIKLSMGGTAFANVYQATLGIGKNGATNLRRSGWHLFTIGAADWTAVNSPDWATMSIQAFRITWTNDSSVTAPNGARICVSNPIMHYRAKAKVLLMTDRTYAATYTTVRPLLNAFGLRATLSVTQSDVGQPGFMTAAQIQQMWSEGHAIVPRNQSQYSSISTVPLALAAMNSEINYLKTLIPNDPSIGKFVTYASGEYWLSGSASGNMTVPDALAAQGVLAGRTTDTTNAPGYMALGAGNYPPNLMVAPIIGIWSNETLANLTSYIDTAIDRQSACCFFCHSPNYTGGEDPKVIEGLYAYIALKKSQGLIDDVTWPEFYSGM